MAQRKPSKGRLSAISSGLAINLNAMRPGAKNPYLAKKRRSSKSKPQGEFSDTTAKLNQATIKHKRRKGKRKSKKLLLIDDDDDEKKPANIMNILNNANYNNPNTPPPPLPPYNNNSNNKRYSGSLIPPTSGGTSSGHRSSPRVVTPSPPPPGTLLSNISPMGSLKDKTPPAPSPPTLASINKQSLNTSHSTTFTVSGYKITIIGHARTGKTSLKDALFGKEFKEMTFPTVKPSAKPTIINKEINIKNDVLLEECETDAVDDIKVNVEYEIWDTPGQAILEFIPPLYITGSFAVFIVYDITDIFSYKRAKYWLNYLEDVAKGYENVALIGNKYDLNNERCISSEDANEYANKHNIFYIEISVKTKYNFDILITWLNTKTQAKIEKEIRKEKKNNKLIDNNDGNNKNKKNKHKRSKSAIKRYTKSIIEQHQRNKKTIQLDEIDVHSRQKGKNKSCCLW